MYIIKKSELLKSGKQPTLGQINTFCKKSSYFYFSWTFWGCNGNV